MRSSVPSHSTRPTLPPPSPDLGDESGLAVGVRVAVGTEALRQLALERRIACDLFRVSGEIVAETQRRTCVLGAMDVYVVGSTGSEGRHALDEEHVMRGRVLRPVHVAEHRLDQLVPA